EIRDQGRRVRRAEAGDWIPTRPRRITGDPPVAVVVRDTGSGRVRDVEVVGRVPRRIRDLVQGRVDQAETQLLVLGLVDLVGDRDQAGPLRTAERCSADVVPP